MSERFKQYKAKLRRKGTLRKNADVADQNWQPEGWDAPEPYSPGGDRCPMCKNHRLIVGPASQPGAPASLLCPECGWAGERFEDDGHNSA